MYFNLGQWDRQLGWCNAILDFNLTKKQLKYFSSAAAATRAGFMGGGGFRAPGLSPTGGLPPNPSIFKTL